MPLSYISWISSKIDGLEKEERQIPSVYCKSEVFKPFCSFKQCALRSPFLVTSNKATRHCNTLLWSP